MPEAALPLALLARASPTTFLERPSGPVHATLLSQDTLYPTAEADNVNLDQAVNGELELWEGGRP